MEDLALLLPAASVTRWILLADLVCLVALGATARRPLMALPLALGGGFVALNVLGMLANDFFVGLALFHLGVGASAAIMLRRARWLGAATLGLALGLGALT